MIREHGAVNTYLDFILSLNQDIYLSYRNLEYGYMSSARVFKTLDNYPSCVVKTLTFCSCQVGKTIVSGSRLQYLGLSTSQLILHVLPMNDVIPSCETFTKSFTMNKVHREIYTVLKEDRKPWSWNIDLDTFYISDLDFLTRAQLNDPSMLPIM